MKKEGFYLTFEEFFGVFFSMDIFPLTSKLLPLLVEHIDDFLKYKITILKVATLSFQILAVINGFLQLVMKLKRATL